jgi:hypothetical protein
VAIRKVLLKRSHESPFGETGAPARLGRSSYSLELAAILAERRASAECMGEDEAMELAVREQHASRQRSDLQVSGARRDIESGDST